MASTNFEVIVVGLGTVGAATCMALARRGVSVLGLDAFHPPHQYGSHHGQSRSIRRIYLEGTGYVPLARQAWELWRRLEKDTGTVLLVPTGNITIGPPNGSAVTGFLASARSGDFAYEEMTAAEIRRRWPHLTPTDRFVGGLEKEAGILFPETAIETFLAEAEKAGAILKYNERVDRWEEASDHIAVRTMLGSYEGGRLLVAAGARGGRLLKSAGSFLSPKRVPVVWIEPPQAPDFYLGRFPVNFWQIPFAGDAGARDFHEFYALPVTVPGGQVKVAIHNHLADGEPDSMVRKIHPREMATIRQFLGDFIPSLKDGGAATDLCFYTMTPDRDFILGPLPGHSHVLTVALAGHGFKFAPVLGEILADLALDTAPPFDVSMFDIGRFANSNIQQ